MSLSLRALPELQVAPVPAEAGLGEPSALTIAERKAVASTLEFVVGEFSPRVASFFTVDESRSTHLVAAKAPERSRRNLAAEVRRWVSALEGIDPLAPARFLGSRVPLATLADVGWTESVLRRPFVLDAYRRIGAVNEARVLIRDGGQLVAGVTLWRGFEDRCWTGQRLDRLAAIQPLIEMAYRKARRIRAATPDREALARLTRRQVEVASLLRRGATNREVARALGISEATARSHTRAVMARLGVSSRREIVLRSTSG